MKPSPPGQCPASTVTFGTRPPLYGMAMKPPESPAASPANAGDERSLVEPPSAISAR